MATNDRTTQHAAPTSAATRPWLVFSYQAFARITARKHGFTVPEVDVEELSDEELQQRVDLLRELSHLPPG